MKRDKAQLGFYINQTRCTGCATCIVACKDWHDIPAGPVSYRRLARKEEGKFPDIFVAYLTTSCFHCLHPACVPACPVGAIIKGEKGIVLVDRKRCLGKDNCGAPCLLACPYSAPQFAEEGEAKMEKCDFCVDRWHEGKKPICVSACPTRALDAGPLEELRKTYGDVYEAELFVYDEKCKPAVVFKPKKRGG